MKNAKKSACALFAILLALLLASCGGDTSGNITEETEHKLLSDWFDCIYMQERNNADALWAISHVERFLEDTTWDKLQCARMAVSTASAYIERREKPAETMTKADYAFLNKQGKETDVARIEMMSAMTARKTTLDMLLNFSIDLEDGVFWKPICETLGEHLKVERGLIEKDLANLAVVTDYLLLTLESEDLTARFRTFTEENCPLIAAYQDSAERSPEALEEKDAKIVEEMEELKHALAKIIGMSNDDLDKYEKLITAQDWDALKREAVVMDGASLLMPLPAWDADTEAVYYWRDADGAVSIPGEGEAIDRPPDRCVFTYAGITEDAFSEYVAFLNALGFEDTLQGTNPHAAYYTPGESELILSWEANAAEIAMLENPVCFVPFWYL